MLAVSPDGGSIAFEYYDYVTGGEQNIYVLELNTGKIKNLTGKLDGRSYCPSWSPDSTKIAFTLETVNNTGIYIMNADGSNLIKLIDNGLWSSWQK